MTDMVAAYSLKPQTLDSAQAILERAAAVQRFRRSTRPHAQFIPPAILKKRIEAQRIEAPKKEWPTIRFLGQCMNAQKYRRYFIAKKPTIGMIQRAICSHFKVEFAELIGPCRATPICLPRQIAIWLCRKVTVRSYPEIGRKFGGRDHSTGINSFNKIERLIAEGHEDVFAAIRAVSHRLNLSEVLPV
jgi:chromosomal replication initiation ATPase DnaA